LRCGDGDRPLSIGIAEKAGKKDGPAREARFNEPRCVVVTSSGTLYVLDVPNRLCKVEDGVVTTLAEFPRTKSAVDGPLSEATFAITDMSGQIALGENDHTLYVADHWHFAARQIDLKTETVSTIVGTGDTVGGHVDGPARTRARVVSGCAFVCWDPVRS
jgi:hypothetical protein